MCGAGKMIRGEQQRPRRCGISIATYVPSTSYGSRKVLGAGLRVLEQSSPQSHASLPDTSNVGIMEKSQGMRIRRIALLPLQSDFHQVSSLQGVLLGCSWRAKHRVRELQLTVHSDTGGHRLARRARHPVY